MALDPRVQANLLVGDDPAVGVAENRAVRIRGVAAPIGTEANLVSPPRLEDFFSMDVHKGTLVKKPRSSLPFVVFLRNQTGEEAFKFRCAGRRESEGIGRHICQTGVPVVGPVFNLVVPSLQVSCVVFVPLLFRAFGEPRHRHRVQKSAVGSKNAVVVEDLQLWVRGIHLRCNAVNPVRVVDFGPAVVAAQAVLHLQGCGVRIVAVSGVLTRAVGSNEPISFFAEFQFVLVKFNVPKTEAVVSLVHRGASAHVESVNQFGAFVGFVRLQAPMPTQTDFEVVGVVVDQVDLSVACAIQGAQTTCIHAVVSSEVKRRTVFVSVDVYGVKSPGVGGIDKRVVDRIVVGGFPIVGREGKGIDLVREVGVTVFVFKDIRPTEAQFTQVSFANSARCAEPGEDEGVLRFHVDDAVEGPGAVVGRAGTRHDFHRLHVEVGRAKKVS